MEKTLKDACQERDKALQELARLKQHLLDKELEESDKMDEDSKLIEELQMKTAHQRNQLFHLEKALKQAN
ncbi:hypothetical protein QJS10_CPA03g00275 [Acorus calamus]|uniref:Uncharacterized protein n=1 Tax=Acorus calamus TaxID=4465 RepID=A0AAV9FAI7_ACOCL|nr:hypothetical protein QJS10_CPA03g00275 [Acorus calamus]